MPRGRPQEFDRDVVLEAAMQSFWDFGYEGASMSTLLTRTGLSKSSLYQAFGNKSELFAECLKRYADGGVAPMRAELAASPTARAYLLDYIAGVADETKGSRRGCLLMNTAEAMPDDEELQEVVRASLKRLENGFTHALKRAQSEGDVDPELDARDLSRFFLASLCGLKMLVKSGASRGAVKRASDIAARAIFFSPTG